jgi:glycosyltransferase involved in cell wall biosynthesis
MVVVNIAGRRSAEELRRLAAQDVMPDGILADDAFGAASLDDHDLAQVSGLRGSIIRRLPIPVALALEAWWRRSEFDVVLSWSERVAFPLALLFALTPRRRTGHIAILMWPFNADDPSALRRWLKRTAYRILARHGMDRLCLPSPRQRQLALERWGIPAQRLMNVGWPIDTNFWRPMEGAEDMLCSVGVEMRDYPTLLEALSTLDIPCHIAGGLSFLRPTFAPDNEQIVQLEGKPLPGNVTVGPKSPTELRDLYARSRIVVVPILPSDSDNGVTVTAEAMAMGRPVIITATEGRARILRDGHNCVLVPPQDPAALRGAIAELWNDPVRCAQMGAAGREEIGAAHGIEQWVSGIKAAASEIAAAVPSRSRA